MDKTEVVFKFAGACAGNGVVAGKRAYGIGSACGRKIVDLSKSGLSAVGGVSAKVVPRAIRREAGERDKTIVRPPEAPPPQSPSPRSEETPKARPPLFARKRRVPAPEPSGPRDKRRAGKSAAPKPKPDQVEAAVFGGATEKFLYMKAASDLEHSDMGIRAEAAGVLGKIRHELSVKTLAARYAAEPSAQVRKEIANALAALGIIEGILPLERAMNDSDAAVRLAALMGVYRLAGAAGAPMIIGMLHDESPEVRRMVACCTGWMGQARMAAELVPLLSDEAVRVRRAAVEAMGYLGDRGVVSALIERLNDADESVRRKAFEAVEKITGKRMGKRYPENEKARERSIARWRHWWREQSAR